MKTLFDLVAKGGPAMIAIIVLSVVLYSRCFQLFFYLRQHRRNLSDTERNVATPLSRLRQQALDLRETFRQERIPLGAMIAAAPLLGLLGTVSGMTKTFESVSSQIGQKSMEGLAGGISEVLISTESGLAVAIPALLFVHLAHRQMHRQLQHLNQLEHGADPEAAR